MLPNYYLLANGEMWANFEIRLYYLSLKNIRRFRYVEGAIISWDARLFAENNDSQRKNFE